MFRKPRETVTSATYIEPSTGRPPTPPNSASIKHEHRMASIQTPPPSTPMPLLGRSKTTPKANVKAASTIGNRSSGKSNSSILSFFKKAEQFPAKVVDEQEEESVFIDDGDVGIDTEGVTQTPTPPRDYDLGKDRAGQQGGFVVEEGSKRYNEIDVPNKRRRISTDNSTLISN
ncbi:MAG: hypothetical protein Q9192_007795, partial [Flavoplaca navasiana]